MVRPRALAALRLMTSSNFVGSLATRPGKGGVRPLLGKPTAHHHRLWPRTGAGTNLAPNLIRGTRETEIAEPLGRAAATNTGP